MQVFMRLMINKKEARKLLCFIPLIFISACTFANKDGSYPRMAPCPESPNCVISKGAEDSRHIEPLQLAVQQSNSEPSRNQKILDILRGGIHTITQAGRGASYIWPIWLTAVLVKEGSNWKFVQMSFSFPTFYPPDIRLTE